MTWTIIAIVAFVLGGKPMHGRFDSDRSFASKTACEAFMRTEQFAAEDVEDVKSTVAAEFPQLPQGHRVDIHFNCVEKEGQPV